MAKVCEGITVHMMNPFHQREPVFYASLQLGSETPKESGPNREETRHRLASTLWHYRAVRGNSPGNSRTDSPIQVVSGLRGRPHLLVGGYRVAISFSEGGGKIWAALSGGESDIGIDAAVSDEFQKGYPLHRVFHPEELHHAVMLADGELGKASALLWSVKEAVAKALGCAFHLVEPRDITVFPSTGDDGYTFPVGLSGKALERVPLAAGRTLWVRSLPHGQTWLSIALLNRRPTVHE